MLKVKGIHTKSPKTNMKPNLSAIMSHLQKTRKGLKRELNHALIPQCIYDIQIISYQSIVIGVTTVGGSSPSVDR